jgi:phosphatidylglycerophosphatase A
MSARTEPTAPASATGASSISASQRKPRFALFIATAGGLGYLPKAPGTWGSLGGILAAMFPWWALYASFAVLKGFVGDAGISIFWLRDIDPLLVIQLLLALAIAVLGTWSANRAAEFWGLKDPGRVVIDEVSGQHLTLVLGCALPIAAKTATLAFANPQLGLITWHTALSWKYLLVGFILFRVFDIWKPFPARQAEALPGGWGIMADDWVAGIYAGIGLWIARAAGL